MAEVATATPSEGPAGARGANSFFWRRLHSLSGIVPIGAFLAFHIFENMSAMRGEAAYNRMVKGIADLVPGPYFYALELGGVMIPIAFHALYGVFIIGQGRPNPASYPYRRNIYYLVQRITGLLALVYIAVHVGALRLGYTLLQKGGGVEGHPGYVNYADVKSHLASQPMFVFYVVGTLSTIFHLTNGLNGFCWTWGITVGEKSRRVVEVIAWLAFFAISIPTLNILYSFQN